MPEEKKLKASSGRAGKKHAGTVMIFIFLLVLGIFMILPVYLAVVMSLKPSQEWFIFPPKLYAMDPTLDNFRDMFRSADRLWVPFSRYVANSVLVTVSVTLAQCFTASMAAFVLAKGKFRGSKFLNSVIVVSLLYQSNVIYIVQYMVISKLGMIDTYLALILPNIATPVGVFLMRQSISQIPDAVIEAAKVDGAGMFRICWEVVMPNQKPALMTLVIFAFQAAWNIQSNTYVFDESLKTLPTAVAQAAASGIARQGVAMAAAVFMLIPPVIVFMAAQKNVIETMAHSGIKD
ncbi:MAG: carbohydrate ABC transporter permease [Oscillospiraceae bacterium]|nr:carbohydrate ABC transporter permease [Oscillospiraceae bacterium]MDO5148665.1 carbohydrate ABC transporter permease [Oscillospiraceae bacterium]